MRPAALLTAVAGITIVAGMLAAGRERFAGPDTAATASEEPVTTAESKETPKPPLALPDPKISMSARPVDEASRFYPAQADGKPLERVATAEPEKPKPEPQNAATLPRPVAESAGILAFGNRKLRLAGIVPTQADKVCKEPDGNEWPCGMLAKTNFRLFLRLRSVTCDLEDANWTGITTASCKIGAQDLSEWLVENGWADAAAGSALAEAAAKAKAEKKGVYGEDPRKGALLTLPPGPPPDNPLDPI
ncbi:thermonuclease family protein [Rhizobium mongolense]|uniref:Endonuclease YncB(Thermonuclease family) n=1 Tax=Rhizobium mongolense TaxID=57676 RepID=A0A7W6RR27_9HYPH|nr:thermonuclease family protein [Rhizobium mongolense]MBB4277004.1 endonuclease YncB(thermonuclease family) [Rhizobium mongolense]